MDFPIDEIQKLLKVKDNLGQPAREVKAKATTKLNMPYMQCAFCDSLEVHIANQQNKKTQNFTGTIYACDDHMQTLARYGVTMEMNKEK